MEIIASKTSSMSSNPTKNSSKGGSGSRDRSGKGVLMVGEVKKISKRVSILEEDIEAMKKVLFETLEESKNLVYEIKQQFHSINNSHQLYNIVAGFMALEDHDETFNRPKEWRHGAGLSEIFHQQPNLPLVFKDLKANVLALEDSAKALDF